MSDKDYLGKFIKNAIAEDLGDGDHTTLSTIPADSLGKARLIIKEEGILAGVNLAAEIFHHIDPGLEMEIMMPDGMGVKFGDTAFTVSGRTHSILLAERLVLNCMQRMSGIATTTRRIAEKLKPYRTRLLDTRKTTPGLRFLEKWAVCIGGGVNHRTGLYDMILIKDNHVDYAGGIKQAILAANNYLEKTKKVLEIEIEVRNLKELDEVIETGNVQRIMLDNFNFEDIRTAVKLIGGRFLTEASGGITEDNVIKYAECGVDFISMGALTHSVKSLDMSLKAF